MVPGRGMLTWLRRHLARHGRNRPWISDGEEGDRHQDAARRRLASKKPISISEGRTTGRNAVNRPAQDHGRLDAASGRGRPRFGRVPEG